MKIDEVDGKIVCTLGGHFDTLQSQELEEALKARLKTPQAVVFEMQDVTYVCSAFLRVCVFVSKIVGPGRYTLLGVTPPIKRVFKMAGMSDLFDRE
jgi:anti-anti-sigma factor